MLEAWEASGRFGYEHPWLVVLLIVLLGWLFPWLRRHREARVLEQAALSLGVCPDCGGRKLGDSFWERGRFRHRLDAQCLNCYSRYPMPTALVQRRVRDALSEQVNANVDEILRDKR